MHGPAGQGALFGGTTQRSLHFPIATTKSGACAPALVATGLRKSSANFALEAADLLREAPATARAKPCHRGRRPGRLGADG